MGSPSSLGPFLGPQEAVFCLSLFRLLLLSLSCFLFLERCRGEISVNQHSQLLQCGVSIPERGWPVEGRDPAGHRLVCSRVGARGRRGFCSSVSAVWDPADGSTRDLHGVELLCLQGVRTAVGVPMCTENNPLGFVRPIVSYSYLNVDYLFRKQVLRKLVLQVFLENLKCFLSKICTILEL